MVLHPAQSSQSSTSVPSIWQKEILTDRKSVDIVLVDQALKDQALLKDAAHNSDYTIIFDSSKDSSEDILATIISWATQTNQVIDSISILSHGEKGSFQLGYERISSEVIINNSLPWQKLSDSLSDNASIYLYSCNTGKDSQGQGLLDTLSTVTGVNVFASSNVTGKGGDWELDVASAEANINIAHQSNTPLDESILYAYSSDLASTTYYLPSTSVNSAWSNPDRVFGSGSASTLSSSDQFYADFNFSMPAGVNIKGITINGRAQVVSVIGFVNLDYALSNDGKPLSDDSKTWSDSDVGTYGCLVIFFCPTTTATAGGSSDLWGHTWTDDSFSNGNFMLRAKITGIAVGVGLNIDYIEVKIEYESASASTTIISVASPSVSANGFSTTTITAQAKDGIGDDFTDGGSIVALSSTGSAIISSVTDNNDGTYTAEISNTVAETVTISGTINGALITDTAVTTFVDSAPGGVASNLTLWFDADVGITGTAAITNWEDQSTFGNDVSQSTAAYQPSLNSASVSMNFHRSIELDGDRDFLETTGVLSSTTADMTYFIVTEVDQSSGNYNKFFGMGSNSDFPHVGFYPSGQLFHYGTDSTFHDFNAAEPLRYNEPIIYTGDLTYPGTDGTSHAYINGQVNSSTTTAANNQQGTGTFVLGGDDCDAGCGSISDEDIDGRIAEFVLYDTVLSATKRQQVETYLAIKYGITLTNNYLDSSATPNTIFALDGTYESDIIGLSKDTDSNLDQRISKSINNGSVLTISTDSDYSSANDSHSDTLIDGAYLVIGHNNGSVTATQTTELDSYFERRGIREWKVQHTGAMGAINMSFSSLPTLSADENYLITEDADGNFSTGFNVLKTSITTTFEDIIFSSGTNYITIAIRSAVNAGNSIITASPASIIADGVTTSTITVQAKDGDNVNLQHGGDNIIINQDGGASISSVTDNNDGTYTATITSIVAESITVSGTLNGSAIAATAPVTFTVGPANATQTEISLSPEAVVANGASSSTITVQAKDAFGNNLITGGLTIAVTENGSATISAVTDNGDGTYTATITDSVEETITVSGTQNGTGITNTATVIFNSAAAYLNNSTLSVSPSTLIANGITSSAITLQVKDSFDVDITSGGLDVVFFQNGAGLISGVTDNGDGTYTATITNTSAETVTISSTIESMVIADTETVTFIPGAVSVDESSISISPASITADGLTTAIITVQANDAFGNSLTSGGLAIGLSEDGNANIGTMNDNSDGTYTATITNTVAETITVSGTIDTNPITNTGSVTFLPGVATTAQTTISVSSATVSANGSATAIITVQAVDTQGNNLTTGGDVITLASSGNATVSGASDNGNGTYTATISNATQESVTISGTLNSSPISDTASVTFVSSSPAGVTSNIRIWLDADAGVDGTSAISKWDDQSGNNKHVEQSSTSNRPSLNVASNSMNFHQSIEFDGEQQHLFVDDIAERDGNIAFFIVTEADNSSGFENTIIAFGNGHADNPHIGFSNSAQIEYEADRFDSSNPMRYGEPLVYSGDMDFTGGSSSRHSHNWLNGTQNPDDERPDSNYEGNDEFWVGGENDTDQDFDGRIAEVIVYADTSGTLQSTTDRQKITSYLSIKYGTSLTHDYKSPSDATIYSVTSYANQIFGLGKKITGGLNQRISRAWNDSAGLILSTDTDYASENNLHADTLADDSYLMMGHDNGSTSSTQTSDLNSYFERRAIREWKVQHTGTVGLINMVFSTLPALGSGESYALIEDADGSFATGHTVLATSNALSFENINFSSGTNYFTVAIIAASSADSTITVSPASVAADGTSSSTITVQANNAEGTNITSGGLTILLSQDGSASIGAVTDNGDGTYTAIITSTTVEPVTISGTLNGAAITSTAALEFTAGAANAGQSTISVSSPAVLADGVSSSTITLQAVDVNGNNLNIGGLTIAFTENGSAIIGAVSDLGNGTYTATITDTVAQAITISGTMNSLAVGDTATVTFTPGIATTAQTTISVSESSVTANGLSISTITVQTVDAFENNLTSGGDTIALSENGSATISAVTDNGDGTYTATITDAITETITISGTLNTFAIIDTAQVIFVAGTPSTADTEITAAPASVTADGVQTSSITVQIKDDQGNNIASGGHAIALSVSGSATVSGVTDNSDGTYSATVFLRTVDKTLR